MTKTVTKFAFVGALLIAGAAFAGAPPARKTAEDFERELSKPAASSIATPDVSAVSAVTDSRCPAGKVWDDIDHWCNTPKGTTEGYDLGIGGEKLSGSARPAAKSNVVSQPAHLIKVSAPAKLVAAANAKSDLLIGFGNGSTKLTPDGQAMAREFVRYMGLDSAKNSHFEISGHTSAVGSRELNMKLSQDRADAVMDYMVTTLHVDQSRLKAKGYGFDQPRIAADPKASGNRRVEAKVLE